MRRLSVRTLLAAAVATAATGALAVCPPALAQGVKPDDPAPEPQPSPPPSELPATDIHLAELAWTDGRPSLAAPPRNATNRAGYDNQPSFTPQDATGPPGFLYTRERKDAGTDIWLMPLDAAPPVPVLESADANEYSPRHTPAIDEISFVRQALDGEQVVYVRDMRWGASEPLTPDNAVGYYAWSAWGGHIAMFVLGEPPTLRLVDLESGTGRVVYGDVGRSMHGLPGGQDIVFTGAREGGGHDVFRLATATGLVTPLFALPGEAQDFTVVVPPEGAPGPGFFAAAEGHLYYRAIADAEWAYVADLAGAGLRDITRLAVSHDARHIAIVAAD